MRNRYDYGFLIGFLISCLMHISVVLAVYITIDDFEIDKPKSTIELPMKLSLNMFAPESEQPQVIERRPEPKPVSREEPAKVPEKQVTKDDKAPVPIPAKTDVIPENKQEVAIGNNYDKEGNETDEKPNVDASMPAIQTAQASSQGTEDETYKILIMAAIEKYKEYPPRARKMNIEGIANVRIKIAQNGDLILVEIAETSGSTILDTNTLTSVKRAAKHFPKLPRDMTFTIPVTYSLIKS